MNRASIRAVFSAALLAAILAACAPLLPKKADIDAVHAAYSAEFSSAFIGDGSGPKAGGDVCAGNVSPAQGSFPRTLQAIHDYQVKYRDDPSVQAEKNHLTVLKGMIYVQTGNTGIARAVAPDVAKATIQGTDDRSVRDSMFQEAYPALVEGWEAVCDLLKARGASGMFGYSDSGKSASSEKRLTGSADALAQLTRSGTAKVKQSGVSTDEGGIYLATTAAIFYYYAYRVQHDSCALDPKRACGDPDQLLRKGASAIEPFLTQDERKVANAGDSGPSGEQWLEVVPKRRQQYVQWYAFLDQAARSAGE